MSRCFIVLGAPLSGVEDLGAMLAQGTGTYVAPVGTLHRRLFNANNISWHNPKDVVWSEDFKKARDEVIAKAGHNGTWAIADVLTSFTIEGWLEALDDFKILGVIRDFNSFVKNASEKFGFALPVCRTIWRKYNDRIALLEREFGPFPSVRFPSKTFDDDVKKLFCGVGLG